LYQIFKDFAGPIATIIAAVAAVSVTAYFAWHQKKIAKEQADIAREKLRHDLKDDIASSMLRGSCYLKLQLTEYSPQMRICAPM
jgi:hypothetical protein